MSAPAACSSRQAAEVTDASVGQGGPLARSKLGDNATEKSGEKSLFPEHQSFIPSDNWSRGAHKRLQRQRLPVGKLPSLRWFYGKALQ